MKSKLFLITTVAIAIGIASCKKQAGQDGPQGSQGPSGPTLTGNLKGFINHYDFSGSKITTNLLGDSVSIDGTSQVSITDAAGGFSFSNLVTGVYNLTIKRTGYGFSKMQSVQFTGGGDTYRNGNISKLPGTNLTTFSAIDTVSFGVNVVRLRGTVPALATTQNLIMYVSLPGNSVVNSTSTNQSNFYVVAINAGTGSLSFKKDIPTTDLYDLGFASGNTIYFAAYTLGGNTAASSYSDLTNNKTIFTALGTTPLYSNAPVQ